MHSYRRLEAWKQAHAALRLICELHLDRLPKQSVWLWRPEKPIT